jgi:hypothetical protein
VGNQKGESKKQKTASQRDHPASQSSGDAVSAFDFLLSDQPEAGRQLPDLRILPISAIVPSQRNPRSDLAREPTALDDPDLLASVQAATEPLLAVPPCVVAAATDRYRLVYGARRLAACQQAGWQRLACLVYPSLEPTEEHQLRVMENQHRAALHPIDQAVELHVPIYRAYLAALTDPAQADAIMATEQPLLHTCVQLREACLAAGYDPHNPPVKPDDVLAAQGIALARHTRQRIGRILAIELELLATLRTLDITEAGLIALGQLDDADQRTLVAALQDDPELVSRVRRISRAVRELDYPIQGAIAEQQGKVYLPDTGEVVDVQATRQAGSARPQSNSDDADTDDPEPAPDAPVTEDQPQPGQALDSAVIDAITELLSEADVIADVLRTIRAHHQGPLTALPAPWNDYMELALTTIREALED